MTDLAVDDRPVLADGGDRKPPSPGKRKFNGRRIILMIFLFLLALSFLTPALWMLNASLRPEEHVMDFPPGFALSHPQWGNYTTVLRNMPVYFLNSVKLAVLNVVGGLIVSSLAGYAFARLTWKGRDALFGIVLVTAIVPNIIYLLPQYILFQKIGWIDTLFPLWVPRVLTPVFGTFLMRQAFKSLPAGLEEAAQVDGASTFRTFLTIMVPQTKPALAAVAMFTFLDSWNDLFGPLIFLTSPDKQTLPIGLAQFQNEFFTQVGPLMAGATVTVLPVFVVFFLAQRYFIQGVTGSGFKG
ncbi:carbohydrate ABC transporter membrane protein 2 (CUT1 family) [Kribbella rubisoli]|uniref:Carbohydrate ABC transporter membrane protein 2 (CUT1 family) n=1 Tax=Kribbella rubisoli TaxID=3075929 RepID=A0A4Q7VYK4_9ACTN|nr:carbohydrate ABC transporter permease [Kribbella rubisoli]RZU01854.1 carbohydrate ABC transporter membrane protein 2 (CUT1 family) [Kribbella rubisoli]